MDWLHIKCMGSIHLDFAEGTAGLHILWDKEYIRIVHLQKVLRINLPLNAHSSTRRKKCSTRGLSVKAAQRVAY